jgi:hypothetical protein
MSIWPALAPDVGKATCTEFGVMSPALKFNDDVDGTPVASPGRTERNPAADGATTVTFNNTPVAPAGTNAPVTCNLRDTPDSNGPDNPNPVRVSRMRSGVTVTSDDAGPDVAFTATNPPPPNVTATAAPIAAHRDRHNPRRPACRVIRVIRAVMTFLHRDVGAIPKTVT